MTTEKAGLIGAAPERGACYCSSQIHQTMLRIGPTNACSYSPTGAGKLVGLSCLPDDFRGDTQDQDFLAARCKFMYPHTPLRTAKDLCYTFNGPKLHVTGCIVRVDLRWQ